jgi:hypothetical protein
MRWLEEFSEAMIRGFEEGSGVSRDNPRFSDYVIFAFLFYGFMIACFCSVLYQILLGK